MFVKKLLFSSILLCAAFCCSEDETDCYLVDCLGVDNSIYLKALDETSGENLFTNGTFPMNEISIVDSNDNPVSFELQKDFENQDLLTISLQDNTIGEFSYEITLGDTLPFTFTLTTFDGGGSDCCGPYTGIDMADLSGIDGEFENLGTLPIAVSVFVP